MKKALKKINKELYYSNSKNEKIKGIHLGISGDVSGIYGNVLGISGDISGISGDVSGISGDVDDCNITDKERKKGIRIEQLIK